MESGDDNMFHELEQRYVSLRKEYENVVSEKNILQGMFI